MKSDKINELYFSDVDTPIKLDRREFLKKLGGGIIVVFALGKLSLLDGWSQSNADEFNFNAYLRVKENGRVDCYTGKIEMGQGIITSLAQVLAEELEVDIDQIDMVMGDTELCPYDAGTWGSLTTRFADPVIRAAAAEAREILIDLASKKLNVATDQLKAVNGKVVHKSDTSNFVTYAQLTLGKKIVQTLSSKPEIKEASEFKIIGKPIKSTDATAKVTGEALYSSDIRLDEMVYASIVRPPSLDAEKVAVDTSQLANFKDVELIEDGNLVAVIHKDPEIAKKAARKVKVTWDLKTRDVNSESIFNYLEQHISESKIFEKEGNLEVGTSESNRIFKTDYQDGYVAHAPIETHAATCYFKDGKLTMWASSQTPFGTQQELSRVLNLKKENIHVKQIFLGGGFGGKIYNQQAVEAAKIAVKCKKPVQLSWSRREEFMYDRFRPAALMKVTSGVDENGKLNLWEFDIYCAGTRGTKLFYNVPNNRTRIFNERGIHTLETGAWRAPGNNSTTFARESHIETMAHAIGEDVLAFRIKNLKSENMIETLKLAAKSFDWSRTKKKNHGFGIALGEDAGTSVAIITEVHVNPETGEVQPIKIVCAQDMGQVVNPHGAAVQTEGGITMGLGYALYEEVEFDGYKVNTRNFSNYEITKFSKTPEITCVFRDKMNSKPQGGGEPAIICVGGAIANAIFDACGARVTRLPVTPKRILEAL
jgi:isoquinoline 1-oxidoreductase